MQTVLSILGCGNMAEAIVRGIVKGGGSWRFVGFDPHGNRKAGLADVPNLTFADTATETIEAGDAVLIAVKPQVLDAALAGLSTVAADGLFVSIVAGKTTATLESLLPGGRVVRTMPNTPLMVGRGVVGLCRGVTATGADVATAKSLFPAAELVDVPESQMDALSAISGCGPAYFFAFTEALAAAAEAQGFDKAIAYRLAAATFTGSAALLAQSDEDAAALRRRVTSPGGMTAAALASFESADLEKVVAEAVAAATRRGRELAAQ